MQLYIPPSWTHLLKPNHMNTSRNHKITVIVEMPMSTERHVECLEINPAYSEITNPIRFTDSPIGAMLSGNIMEEEATPRKQDREKFAEALSKRLTRGIVKGLESQDTFNGY